MGIVTGLFSVTGILIATLLAIVAVKWTKSWFALDFYRKQNIKVLFQPISSFYSLFIKQRKPGQRRADEDFVEYAKDAYSRGAFATNRFGGKNCNVVLLTAEYMKEFLLKEDHFARRFSIANFPVNMGFIFESGPQAMHKRGIFNEILGTMN